MQYIYDFVAIYVNFGFMAFNFCAVNSGKILNFFYAAAQVFSLSLNTTYFAPMTLHHQYQYVSFNINRHTLQVDRYVSNECDIIVVCLHPNE